MKTLSPDAPPRGWSGWTPERKNFTIFDDSSSSEEDEDESSDEEENEHQEVLNSNKGILKKPQYKKLLHKEELLPE